MTIDFLEIMKGVRLAGYGQRERPWWYAVIKREQPGISMPVQTPRQNDEPGSKMCAMEMVAFLEGEKRTDRPSCACPVITQYVIAVNDSLHDRERNRLLPYLPRVVGTRAGNEVMAERAKALLWFALRELAATKPDVISAPLPEMMPASGEKWIKLNDDIWTQWRLQNNRTSSNWRQQSSRDRTREPYVTPRGHVASAISDVAYVMRDHRPFGLTADQVHSKYLYATKYAIKAIILMGAQRPPETRADLLLPVLDELLQVHPSTAGFSQPLPAPGEAARRLGMIEA